MKLNNLLFLFLMASALGFSACSEDEIEGCTNPNAFNFDPEAETDDGSCQTPYEFTQEMLDGATTVIRDSITGGGPGPIIAHNGVAGAAPTETYRDVFANIQAGDPIVPGTIIVKKVYARDTVSGDRGNLQVVFAMLKQNPGYDPGNGDWEYVLMPFDSTHDYNAQPYGILPAYGADRRGFNLNDGGCQGCHSQADGDDFLFEL